MTWLKWLRTVCILGGASLMALGGMPAAGADASPALLLCLDRSGSMGAPAMAAMQAALRQSLLAGDGKGKLPLQVALTYFGTRTQPMLALTDDPARLDAAIAKLDLDRTREGKTRLYDAVAGGLAQLRGSDAAVKRLIVVSDGDDEGSDISQAQLVQRIVDGGTTIDAIAFGKQAAGHSGSLSTIAGAGNGSFQIAAQAADLNAALARLVKQAVGKEAMAPKASSAPAVAPAAPPSASSAASSATDAAPQPPSLFGAGWKLTVVGRFVLSVPPLAWGGLGLLLLILILLAVLLVRRSRVAGVDQAREPAPPTYVPAPQATRVNTVPPSRLPEPVAPAAPARRTTVGAHWPTPDGRRAIALLKVGAGGSAVRSVEMREATLRLGWDRNNDVVLEKDDYVSAHHAVLRAEANKLYLDDLNARNGSELNGVRFKGGTRTINPGDRITLGRTSIEVLGVDHGY